MGISETLPWTVIEAIPGLLEDPVLITNDEGEDDDEEWFLSNFGRDEEYAEAYGMYRWLVEYGKLPYYGGWAEQLAIDKEIIDLFAALDRAIERPKQEG